MANPVGRTNLRHGTPLPRELHEAHFRAAKPKPASGELERLIGRDARQAGFVGAPIWNRVRVRAPAARAPSGVPISGRAGLRIHHGRSVRLPSNCLHRNQRFGSAFRGGFAALPANPSVANLARRPGRALQPSLHGSAGCSGLGPYHAVHLGLREAERLRQPFSFARPSESRFKHHLHKGGNIGARSDVALCSGLAPLTNNHFGGRTLLRSCLRLHAINATALIEETVIFWVVVGSTKFRVDAGTPELPPRKVGPTGSKRLHSPYRSGRQPDWLKFKNREAPAVSSGRGMGQAIGAAGSATIG